MMETETHQGEGDTGFPSTQNVIVPSHLPFFFPPEDQRDKIYLFISQVSHQGLALPNPVHMWLFSLHILGGRTYCFEKSSQ